jgi:hypothetical protein
MLQKYIHRNVEHKGNASELEENGEVYSFSPVVEKCDTGFVTQPQRV